MFCFLLPLSYSFKGVKENHGIIFIDNYQVKHHANSAGMSCYIYSSMVLNSIVILVFLKIYIYSKFMSSFDSVRTE